MWNTKLNELETHSKHKKIRDLYKGINKFKKGRQLRTNLVKYENGNSLAEYFKFSILETLQKKWNYNETVHQLLLVFKKAYDIIKKEEIVKYSHWDCGAHEIRWAH
jgi:hypothetical protein